MAARRTVAKLDSDDTERQDGRTLPFKSGTTVQMRRVSFYVPEPLYNDIQQFAQERGDTITGVLRWSLGIGKAVWDEIRDGHRIRSSSPDGTAQKELIFGRY